MRDVQSAATLHVVRSGCLVSCQTNFLVIFGGIETRACVEHAVDTRIHKTYLNPFCVCSLKYMKVYEDGIHIFPLFI